MEFTKVAEGDGLEVFESTESFAKVDPARLAEAFKAHKNVVAIGASAGGPIFVRIAKEA